MSKKNSSKHAETIAIRTQSETTQFREHSTPVYLTSSFIYDDAEQMRAIFADEEEGLIYSRFSNPNAEELQEKIRLLEGAEAAYATASGMAAVFASFMALLKTGDHLLVSRSIFGSTHTVISKYLPKWGIEFTYADADKPETWEALIQKNTKMIFVETPSNPGLDILDLDWLGELAKKHQLILNVDNCFATPCLQRPIDFGAHLVTHSATKFIDGQGRVLGGIIAGKKELIEQIYLFCRSTGPSISPFNAWLLSKSLETLPLRMERHSENAKKLAEFLEKHSSVKSVKYPGLKSHPQFEIAEKQMKSGGAIVVFSIKGGIKQGQQFLDALQMASLTANLGDTRTIVTHPASTTHAKLTESERLAVGITPDLVRVSVGLEHISDIISDIDQALKKIIL
ncbi:MAG TPA: O-succinylhomoserine sulfhydrylase [Bacteroidia bacterium]|nr:O-succinylhomoserine sulfhydrylase [Bacteroidia bacterium]